jgi:hypothetical protein
VSAEPGRRGPSAEWWWALGVLAAALLLAVLATRWTFDMWRWQNDEFRFREVGSWVAGNLPGSLWNLDQYDRGVQRFSAWLLGFSVDWFGAPAGFRIGRWVTVLAWASTVLPVWLLARRAGASRPWAAVGALLAIVIPWAGYSGTFLTEPLAYPLFAWACLAIWLAAVEPSVRHDLLALVAIGAAMLARTGMVVLIVVLVVVIAGQELRLLVERGVSRAGVAEAVRRHRVLAIAGAIALVGGLVGGLAVLQGSWYENTTIRLGSFWTNLVGVVAPVASGTWFVPVIAALALAVAELRRPSSPQRLALGLLVVGAFLDLVLTLSAGPYEERYFFYVVAPCAAALAVAASGRSTPGWAVAVSTLFVLTAVVSIGWSVASDFWGYLVFPANVFGAQAMRLGVNERLPDWLQMDPTQIVVLIVAAAGIVTALLVTPPRPGGRRERSAGVVGAVLGGALLLAVAGQTAWALEKFRTGGGGGASLSARTAFEAEADGRSIGLWLPPANGGPSWLTRWQDLEYYVPAVDEHVRVDSSQDAAPLPENRVQAVRVDPATGFVIDAAGAPAQLPPLMAVAPAQVTAPLRGRTVARDRALGLDLVVPRRPASVRWLLTGAAWDGWMGGARAELRAYRVAAGACLALTLTPPSPAPVRVRVTGPAGSRSVRLRGAPVPIQVPLGSAAATASVGVRPTGPRVTLPDGRAVVLNVLPRGVVPCAGA